jgi:hypothetical protein
MTLRQARGQWGEIVNRASGGVNYGIVRGAAAWREEAKWLFQHYHDRIFILTYALQ